MDYIPPAWQNINVLVRVMHDEAEFRRIFAPEGRIVYPSFVTAKGKFPDPFAFTRKYTAIPSSRVMVAIFKGYYYSAPKHLRNLIGNLFIEHLIRIRDFTGLNIIYTMDLVLHRKTVEELVGAYFSQGKYCAVMQLSIRYRSVELFKQLYNHLDSSAHFMNIMQEFLTAGNEEIVAPMYEELRVPIHDPAIVRWIIEGGFDRILEIIVSQHRYYIDANLYKISSQSQRQLYVRNGMCLLQELNETSPIYVKS